jgi:hypothetical protein
MRCLRQTRLYNFTEGIPVCQQLFAFQDYALSTIPSLRGSICFSGFQNQPSQWLSGGQRERNAIRRIQVCFLCPCAHIFCSLYFHRTVSAAIAALGTGTTAKSIFIYPGTYKEQVLIKYGGPLTIYGSTTKCVFPDY